MFLRVATVAALLFASAADSNAQRGSTRKNGSVAGRIIHADGAAAEGARVAVYAIRDGAPAAILGTAVSEHDGRDEVTGLPAGLPSGNCSVSTPSPSAAFRQAGVCAG